MEEEDEGGPLDFREGGLTLMEIQHLQLPILIAVEFVVSI